MTAEEKPVKIDKWDSTALKNALDDAARKVLVDNFGYTESHGLMDGRLGICTAAVSFALFALLWDYLNPFPISRPVLIICVVSYFILMGVLTVYTMYREKGIFVVAFEKDRSGLDPDSVWTMTSRLKRYDDKYTITLKYLNGKSRNPRSKSVTKSVGNYFDNNGTLCGAMYEADINKMHDALKVDKRS